MRVPPALFLLLLAGCAPGTGLGPQPDRFGGAVSTKQVVTKRAPETLLAEDGSACRVSPDRFAGTAVGDLVRCAWRRG